MFKSWHSVTFFDLRALKLPENTYVLAAILFTSEFVGDIRNLLTLKMYIQNMGIFVTNKGQLSLILCFYY